MRRCPATGPFPRYGHCAAELRREVGALAEQSSDAKVPRQGPLPRNGPGAAESDAKVLPLGLSHLNGPCGAEVRRESAPTRAVCPKRLLPSRVETRKRCPKGSFH